jgi:hypothetical protein
MILEAVYGVGPDMTDFQILSNCSSTLLALLIAILLILFNFVWRGRVIRIGGVFNFVYFFFIFLYLLKIGERG